MKVEYKDGLYYKSIESEPNRRRKYLSAVAEVHQTIKKAGVNNIPDAWFEDNEEGGYLVEKEIPFPDVNSIINELSKEEKKHINIKRFEILDKIKRKTGIVVYDNHLRNVLYDKDNKEVYIIDFEQANVLREKGFTRQTLSKR